MADVSITQLDLVIPKSNSSILLSQDGSTARTLASSLTANCLAAGTIYQIEYLVVGGGGGGGQDYGGGGGAGGFLEGNTQIAVGQTYPVIVGKGGTREYQYIVNKNGGNSSFNNVIAYGGGKGGGHNAYSYNMDTVGGADGGSGGGPYRTYTNSEAKGRGIFSQGHDSAPGSVNYGGAGGGAGGPGGTDNQGGLGKYSTITGTNTYYASGGTIKNSGVALPDKPSNTGYGGDANFGPWGAAGGGGSGIVVIAYPGTPRGTAYLNSTTILTPDTTSRPGYTIHKFLIGGYYIA